FYPKVDAAYGRLLVWSLQHRPVMLGIAGLVTLSAAFLYPYIGKELVPDDDQSEFNISVRLPKGTSYQRTEEFVKPIEKDVLSLPALRRAWETVNADSVSFILHMTDIEERNVSQQDVMVRARQLLRKYQGARISVSASTGLSGATNRGGGTSGNKLTILI